MVLAAPSGPNGHHSIHMESHDHEAPLSRMVQRNWERIKAPKEFWESTQPLTMYLPLPMSATHWSGSWGSCHPPKSAEPGDLRHWRTNPSAMTQASICLSEEDAAGGGGEETEA